MAQTKSNVTCNTEPDDSPVRFLVWPSGAFIERTKYCPETHGYMGHDFWFAGLSDLTPDQLIELNSKGIIMDFNINLYTEKGVLSLPLKFYPHKSSNCDVEDVRDHVKEHLSEFLNDTSHIWVETNEEMS